MKDFEKVQISSRADLREWLSKNHDRKESVWLVRFKKQVTDKHVSYDELVEEALCFGWIDSVPKKLDEDRTMVLLSPRKQGSNWSKMNKERVERLLEKGLIEEPGLEKIEAAKLDGSWDALNDVDNLVVPQDLASELDLYPSAKKNFEAFPPSTRRGILEWIHNAKREATRAKRISETASLAEENIRANQPKSKSLCVQFYSGFVFPSFCHKRFF